MFEKKQKKLSLLDKLPSSYEDITSDKERWHHANRLYSVVKDKMYRYNPSTSVCSDLETDELIGITTMSTVKNSIFVKEARLFTEKNSKEFGPRLPESLI